MGKLTILWCAWAGMQAAAAFGESLDRFEVTQTEMAVPIRIVIYSRTNATADAAAKAAFGKFHELNAIFSDYDPESEARRLCDTSSEGKPIRVSDDLWRVLVRSLELSEKTDGAFDVTVGPLVHIWRNARRTKELPQKTSLEAALTRVGYRFVRLHPEQQSVELLRPNMRLDFGGIAKGYAVDEAMKVLRQHGFTHVLVDAGGNLGLGDPPPDKPGWRIGTTRVLADADQKSADKKKPPREYLWLSQVSISTSGDLRQYAVIGGVRYSHLINPKTGMALTEHNNVTVIGPDGLSTDGVSSAIAILGPEKGLKLIEKTPSHSVFIVRIVDGKEQTYESSNWKTWPRAGAGR